MGSPCEIQVDGDDPWTASKLGKIAEAEALRIERKYSRYRRDSVLSQINSASGQPVGVDTETAALLDYADQCHTLSGGRFDITSGVLRRAWTFDGSDRLPDVDMIQSLLPLVGWSKVGWDGQRLTLPKGMEIDFGGLGKEYAVDLALQAVANTDNTPMLVNFGGDLRVTGPRADGSRWRVMIEDVDQSDRPGSWLEMAGGGITTSGDARRFLEKDGVRYGHILDPRTGWPVRNAPRSITVAAATCMEAGILSTLAMLHGEGAETFLTEEGVASWVIR